MSAPQHSNFSPFTPHQAKARVAIACAAGIFMGSAVVAGLGHAIWPDVRSSHPGLSLAREKPRFAFVAALDFRLLIAWLGAVFPPSQPADSAFFSAIRATRSSRQPNPEPTPNPCRRPASKRSSTPHNGCLPAQSKIPRACALHADLVNVIYLSYHGGRGVSVVVEKVVSSTD